MTSKFSFPAAALLLASSGASAQNGPGTQPLPGLDNFSIPSSRPTPQRTPEAEPTVRPTPSATPRATPPPVVPTVRPTPAPRATPSPATVRTATPRAVAIPQPARPAPIIVATPLPQASPIPQATPAPIVTPVPLAEQPAAAVATPPPVPVTSADQVQPPGTPVWIWAMAGCVLLALVIGSVGWWWPRLTRARVRGGETSADREILVLTEIDAPPPRPVPAVPPSPVPPAEAPQPMPPPPWLTGDRATVDLELIPNRAGTDQDGLAVDYLLVLRNTGRAPATDIHLDVRLFGAGPDQDAIIAALFGTAIAKPISPPFDLPAGSTIELGGSGTHPRDTLAVMTIAGQAAVVPVLAVNVEYDWTGGHGQTAQSYVIGIARGAEAKLQPFPLDPPRMYESVSALDYTVAVAS